MAAALDVYEYLTDKGLGPKQSGQECRVHCWECEAGAQKREGKLYVNRETWLWKCFRCDASGGQKALLEHFGDLPDDWRPSTFQSRTEALDAYVSMCQDMLLNNDAMLDYLVDRGLTVETIVDARLGYHPRMTSITQSMRKANGDYFSRAELDASLLASKAGHGDFLSGCITIPYIMRGQVVQVRGKDPQGKYRTLAGDSARMFNQDDLSHRKVIITEGEFDALILKQTLQASPDLEHRSMGVVGLAGVQTWPGGRDGFAKFFDSQERVFIGFDSDGPGRTAAISVKDAIGTTSTIIELPVDDTDWTDWLAPVTPKRPNGGHLHHDVWDLVLRADRAGKTLFSLAEVHQEWKDVNGQPGFKFGWPSVDAVISPGPRPGNLVIPVAGTGTGKTVFLANLAWNLRHRRVMYVTLENTATELFEIMQRIVGFWHPGDTPREIAQRLPLMGIHGENDLKAKTLAVLMDQYEKQWGDPAEVVIVDYLGYWANSMRGTSNYDRVSEAVFLAKAAAKARKALFVTPSQVSRKAGTGKAPQLADMRDSGKVEETGDFVLGLHRPAMDPEIGGSATDELWAQMVLEFLKSRRGGTGRTVKLAYSQASLAIVDPQCDDRTAVHRVIQENARLRRGEPYNAIRRDSFNMAHRSRQQRAEV